MKKGKLLASIVSLCFALAVLTFGVFAAQQVNYSVNGTINYQVQDAYVQISTYLFKYGDHGGTTATDLTSTSDLETKAGQWTSVTSPSAGSIGTTHLTQLNATNENPLASGTKYLSYDTEANPPVNDSVSQDIVPTLSLNTTDAKAYFIVIHVKNLGTNTIHAGLCGVKFYTLDENENEVVADSSNLITYSTDMFTSVAGSSNTTNIVIGLTLKDKKVNISTIKFRFNVEIGNGDPGILQYSMGKGYYVNMGYYTIDETQYPVEWRLRQVVDSNSDLVNLDSIEKPSDLSGKTGTFVQVMGVGVSKQFYSSSSAHSPSGNHADDYYESDIRTYLTNEDANATAETSYLKALGITTSDPVYSAISPRSIADLYSRMSDSKTDVANTSGHTLSSSALNETDSLWLLSYEEGYEYNSSTLTPTSSGIHSYYNGSNPNTLVTWMMRTPGGHPYSYNYWIFCSAGNTGRSVNSTYAVRAAFNIAF